MASEIKIGTCGIIILALIVLFGVMMLAPTSVIVTNAIRNLRQQTA